MLPELRIAPRRAHIVLRDPTRRNALDSAALAQFEALVKEVTRSADIDVVVIEGEGASFCSGFDLAACAEVPARARDLLAGLAACVCALRELDMPVVARVQGAALAGGCALLTGCDFVVVATDAQLGYPVHRIGISPAVTTPTLLSRMGPGARALLLSNELIDGRTALARGLATHCAEPAELDTEVDRLVERLLAKGPTAMRATKRWIREIERRGAGDIGPSTGRDGAATAAACSASLELVAGDEFASMLRTFWAARSQGR
jgi:methylglutaconyl-CoA hydratase